MGNSPALQLKLHMLSLSRHSLVSETMFGMKIREMKLGIIHFA
jgi:hypothetical protein